MPIETQDLEKKLQKIEQQSGLTAAIVSANSAIQQNNFNKTTKLGTQVGQVTAGYQSLTQEADDIAPGVFGSQPEQLVVFGGDVNPPIVQLTTELPGLKNQVKKKVTQYMATSYVDDDYVVDNREVLRSISGVDSSDNDILSGFLKVQVTSGEPEAIAYSTKKAVASATPEQVKTVVSNLQNFENKSIELYETASDDLLDPIVGVATGTVSSLNEATSSVQNIAGDISSTLSQATTQINNTVQQINNTVETIKEAKDFIDNAPVRLESAISKIEGMPIPKI